MFVYLIKATIIKMMWKHVYYKASRLYKTEMTSAKAVDCIAYYTLSQTQIK